MNFPFALFAVLLLANLSLFDDPRQRAVGPQWLDVVAGHNSMIPRASAIVTACVRSVAASFSRMCFMCTFTVSSEM